MCGYDPFYWLDRELDVEYERESKCLQQKNEENTSEAQTSQVSWGNPDGKRHTDYGAKKPEK